MIEIRPLRDSSFPDFVALLRERGEAPQDYYRWKYLRQPSPRFPTGFIAYDRNMPVGCIGNINTRVQDANGKCQDATWFADWFVAESARGSGIGTELMRCVAACSRYAFGIPGPVAAQRVAEKAGYRRVPHAYDLTVPLRRFNFGYSRGGGSVPKRWIRGLHRVAVLPRIRRADRSLSLTIIDGKPNPRQWFSRHAALRRRQSFERDPAFLTWFLDMPESKTASRTWWYIDEPVLYACGCIDSDFWGLRRGRLFDCVYDQSLSLRTVLDAIGSCLKENKVDLLKGFVTPESQEIELMLERWISNIPLYAIDPELVAAVNVAMMERESSWRDFLLR